MEPSAKNRAIQRRRVTVGSSRTLGPVRLATRESPGSAAPWRASDMVRAGRRARVDGGLEYPLVTRGSYGVRCTPSADLVRRRAALARRSARVHGGCTRSRLHAPLRERPSRVLAPVARRADGAGRRAGAQRSDDARDDGRRAGAPWTGGNREDPRGDRPAVRRPAGGRARSRFVCSGLRAGRRAVRGALEAAGRGSADAACVLASRRRRVRGHVLLHRRLHARPRRRRSAPAHRSGSGAGDRRRG